MIYFLIGYAVGIVFGIYIAVKLRIGKKSKKKTDYKAEIDKAVKQRKPHIATRKVTHDDVRRWLDEDKQTKT